MMIDTITQYAYERIMKREGLRLPATTLPEGCLLWPGATNGSGYGKLLKSRDENTTVGVHRVVYAVREGLSLSDLSLEVLHKCDTPQCYEPTHLSYGTHKQNMEEMSERKRVAALWVCQSCGRKKTPGRCLYCAERKRIAQKTWDRRRYLRNHPEAKRREGEA